MKRNVVKGSSDVTLLSSFADLEEPDCDCDWLDTLNDGEDDVPLASEPCPLKLVLGLDALEPLTIEEFEFPPDLLNIDDRIELPRSLFDDERGRGGRWTRPYSEGLYGRPSSSENFEGCSAIEDVRTGEGLRRGGEGFLETGRELGSTVKRFLGPSELGEFFSTSEADFCSLLFTFGDVSDGVETLEEGGELAAGRREVLVAANASRATTGRGDACHRNRSES